MIFSTLALASTFLLAVGKYRSRNIDLHSFLGQDGKEIFKVIANRVYQIVMYRFVFGQTLIEKEEGVIDLPRLQ